MTTEGPFSAVALTPAVGFLLTEDYGFDLVEHEDGRTHLVPPLDMLLKSEFMSEKEEASIRKRAGGMTPEQRQQMTLEVWADLSQRENPVRGFWVDCYEAFDEAVKEPRRKTCDQRNLQRAAD